MHRFTLLSLLALAFLNVGSTAAQKAGDETAVRATVADYIEGYYAHTSPAWNDRYIPIT